MLSPQAPIVRHERRDGSEPSRLMDYLPGMYAGSLFMQDFLRLLDTFWLPLEHKIDRMHTLFDPHRTPHEFLPWLSTWVDMVLDENLSEQQARTLVHHAADLYRRRGTAGGLSDYVRICTGRIPEIIEDGTPDNPFHFTVKLACPDPSRMRDRIVRMIEEEKPAHTNYTLILEEG